MTLKMIDRPEAKRHRKLVGTAHRRPRGFTLIEVGVAVTLAAVVMGGATALIVGMSRTNNAVRERLEQIAVRSRLTEFFRADVARAQSCTIDEKQPGSGILLHTDDEHSVRYVAGENDVQRIAEKGDQVTARDTFYLGDRQRATLTMTTGSLRQVRCTIEPVTTEADKPPAGAKPRPALIVFAVLGRNDRLVERVRKALVRPKTERDSAPATPETKEPAP